MIDVAAGKKECFFEDLHKNDKVGLPIVAVGGPMLTEYWDYR